MAKSKQTLINEQRDTISELRTIVKRLTQGSVFHLYEARNGMEGCSYVRCYIWASCLEDATGMAKVAFHEMDRIASGVIDFSIKVLLTGTSGMFCTRPSDEGWET